MQSSKIKGTLSPKPFASNVSVRMYMYDGGLSRFLLTGAPDPQRNKVALNI